MSIHDSAPSGFYRCQLFVCAYFDYCIYLKTQLSLWSSETKTHAFTKTFLFWNFVTLWLLRFTTGFTNAKEVFSFISIHDSAPSEFYRCQLFVCAYFDKTQLSLWSCETKTHAFMKKKFLFWNFVTLWLLRFTTRFMNAKEVVYLYVNSWQCPIWVLQVSAFRVCINFDIVFILQPIWVGLVKRKKNALTNKKSLFLNCVTLRLLRFTTRFMNTKEVVYLYFNSWQCPSGFYKCQLFKRA